MQSGLVLEEHVDLKGFRELEEEEAKERHVVPEPGGQLEDVQVDLDTGEREYINLCEKHKGVLHQHTMAGAAGIGASGGGG